MGPNCNEIHEHRITRFGTCMFIVLFTKSLRTCAEPFEPSRYLNVLFNVVLPNTFSYYLSSGVSLDLPLLVSRYSLAEPCSKCRVASSYKGTVIVRLWRSNDMLRLEVKYLSHFLCMN